MGSPTGPVDIDIVMNPKSAMAGLRELDKLRQDVVKGIAGAEQKWDTAFSNFSKNIATFADRGAKAQERYVRSIEMTAAAYGKSGVEKLISQRDQLIKRLGDEEKAVQRVTAAYAKMIEIEKNKKHGEPEVFGLGTGTPAGLLIRSIKDFAEGRMGYGAVTGASAISGLSGIAAAAGITATAIGALTLAGFHAAESLATLGEQYKHLEARTGFTVRQINEFGFAAKAVGQDIDIYGRIMRGLSTAIMDTSSASEGAKKRLREFGIDIRDVREGTASTAEVMEKIGEGLAKLPAGVERTKAAMELLKRAGIEATPLLVELVENLALAREHGWGPDESDIAGYAKLHKELEILSADWEDLKRQFKEGLVISIRVIGNLKDWLTPGVTGIQQQALEEERRRERLAADIDRANRGAGLTLRPGMPPETQLDVLRMQSLRGLPRSAAWGGGAGFAELTAEQSAKLRSAAMYERDLQNYREGLRLAQEGATKEERRLDALAFRNWETSQGPSWKLRQEEAKLAKMERPDETTPRAKTEEYERQQKLVESLREQNKAYEQQKGLLEQIRKIQIDAAQQAAHPYGMTQADRELLRFSEQKGVTPAQIAAYRAALVPQANMEVSRLIAQAQGAGRAGLERAYGAVEGIARTPEAFVAQLSAQQGASARLFLQQLHEEGRRLSHDVEVIKSIQSGERQLQEQTAEQSIRSRYALAPSTISTRLGAAVESAAIRKQIADQELADAKSRIDAEHVYMLTTGKAEKGERESYEMELYDVRVKHETEIAAIRSKLNMEALEEMRHQLDEIKDAAQSLYHTLFTDPSKFGSQLKGTLRNAALRPIESGLSEMTSRALHPLIFGAGGTGGIAGVLGGAFGGGLNSVRVDNGAMLVKVVGVQGGGGGLGRSVGGGGLIQIGGGGGGGGGILSLPLGMLGGSVAGGEGLGALFGGMPGYASGIGPGGTAGFAPGSVIGGSGGIGGGTGGGGGIGGIGSGLLQVLGAGGRSGGRTGLSGLLGGFKGFKGINWGGWTREPVYGTDAEGNDAQTGSKKTGVDGLLGAALFGGGMALATRGLLGNARGTWSGVAQGTAGGAMIGLQMGGPLGAAIGAAAGFGIGIGEKLAGVESPLNQAKRLVRQAYHIDISNSMANQIVGIAKQSYGGTMSIAVMSPEVRQMLGLYAAGTGQANRFPQSAMTPHGGSLVESGGRLFQESVYQYGNPYSYQSNLPVYGGVAGGNLPAPGGGGGQMFVSLNLSGKDAASFMTGSYVTPSFVSSQYSAALASSQGRQSTAMTFSEPGSIVS